MENVWETVFELTYTYVLKRFQMIFYTTTLLLVLISCHFSYVYFWKFLYWIVEKNSCLICMAFVFSPRKLT